jgi:hypothetical protein
MKPAEEQTKNNAAGFTIPLTDETNLGIAMLIVEDHAGDYLPLGLFSTIGEAREIARRDLRYRMKELDLGGEPICPAIYKVWARGVAGFAVAAEFDPTNL